MRIRFFKWPEIVDKDNLSFGPIFENQHTDSWHYFLGSKADHTFQTEVGMRARIHSTNTFTKGI